MEISLDETLFRERRAMHYIELKQSVESQMQISLCNGCDACWLRCSEGIHADRQEWEILNNYIVRLNPTEKSDLERVLAQDKSVDLGDDVNVKMCRYFDMDSHRCSVYPVRPLVCRLLGHVEWMPCPIEKIPIIVPTSEALVLMQAYSERERKTFEGWEIELDAG